MQEIKHDINIWRDIPCSWVGSYCENDYTAAAVKSLQSCPTLSNAMDCSLPGSSIHGIFQVRVLEWGAIAFSKRAAGTA